MKLAHDLRSARGTWVRAVVLAVSLVGCGKGDAPEADPWLRVEIAGSSTDRPWPSVGFRLKAADGHEVALAPVAGKPAPTSSIEGPVLEGRGAPGRYVVLPPVGWVASSGHDGVDLRPDLPPTKVAVGRPHTLYAFPPEGKSISSIRCVRQATFEVLSVAIEAETVLGDDGAAALRVPDAEWRGILRVHAIFGPSAFAAIKPVVIDQFPEGSGPVGVYLVAMPSAPVAIRVIRPVNDDMKTPIELMASIAVAPMQVGVAVPLDSRGRASLDELPREVTGLSLFVKGAQTWDALDAARLYREVRLFASTATDAERGGLEVRLSDAKGAARPVIEVRPEGGPTYAMPSFTETRDGTDGFRIRTSLPAGRYHVLVTCGGRGAVAAEPVDVVSGKDATLSMRAAELGKLRISLVGGVAAGKTWELVARRVEGAAEVEGQGLVVRGLGRPTTDLEVPPGRYRVRAIVGGTEGTPVEVDLSDAGTQASIDVRPQ